VLDTPEAPLVLAVNDEPDILALYAEVLAEEGYRVVTRHLPLTSLADVTALAPDLIVLDILMDRLDWGTTFLEMLRTNPATQNLPVVICTTAPEVVEAIAPQLAAWGVTVVHKPFDIDDFTTAVRSKLGPGAGERS
jgi:CheY-like chemotaxis protein